MEGKKKLFEAKFCNKIDDLQYIDMKCRITLISNAFEELILDDNKSEEKYIESDLEFTM